MRTALTAFAGALTGVLVTAWWLTRHEPDPPENPDA